MYYISYKNATLQHNLRSIQLIQLQELVQQHTDNDVIDWTAVGAEMGMDSAICQEQYNYNTVGADYVDVGSDPEWVSGMSGTAI